MSQRYPFIEQQSNVDCGVACLTLPNLTTAEEMYQAILTNEIKFCEVVQRCGQGKSHYRSGC